MLWNLKKKYLLQKYSNRHLIDQNIVSFILHTSQSMEAIAKLLIFNIKYTSRRDNMYYSDTSDVDDVAVEAIIKCPGDAGDAGGAY